MNMKAAPVHWNATNAVILRARDVVACEDTPSAMDLGER